MSFANWLMTVGWEFIAKNNGEDVPPPGPGFETKTSANPELVRLEAGICASK